MLPVLNFIDKVKDCTLEEQQYAACVLNTQETPKHQVPFKTKNMS